MADVAITATSVLKNAGGRVENGIIGATLTAGQIVYKDALDGDKYKLSDNDSATAAVRVPVGFALNGGAVGQPVSVQYDGDITIGGGLTAGLIYCLGDVAGALRPSADNGAGDYTCIMGVARSATVLAIKIFAPGVAQ